jgi:hypothetical protein
MENIRVYVVIILTGLIMLGVIGFAIMKPYFEAKAFNDCTGGNASYLTAVFTQLRVDNCNK